MDHGDDPRRIRLARVTLLGTLRARLAGGRNRHKDY
jgi:hypothetical protein